MKTIVFSIVLIGLTFCASAQISTNQPARLKTKVISYEGKISSGARGVEINFAPESTYPGNGGSDTVTSSGHESELKWTFVGRNGNKDVYRFTFTRKTKKDSSSQTTTSKEIQFNGKQVIVFEDELHTVVMEGLSEEDLKTAKGH
jgi:hypothetical protein